MAKTLKHIRGLFVKHEFEGYSFMMEFPDYLAAFELRFRYHEFVAPAVALSRLGLIHLI
jgi:hypothetical protein